jgi:diamine N-acetyltransferase
MIGPNLLLRAPEPTDTDRIMQWENDVRIWHLGNTLAPVSRFAVEQFILSAQDVYASRQMRLMIDLHSAGPANFTIGAIDLYDFEPLHRRAGIGILIDESARGKGYATEALDLFTTYCFETLNLHQVYCTVDEDNTESTALFLKAGFLPCGRRKEWYFRNGKWTDELLFQRIRTR